MPPPPNGSGGTGDEGFHDPPSTWDRFGGHFAGDFTGRWRSLHLCQQGIEFTRCRGEHHENSGEAGQAAHQTEDRAYCSCSPREEFEFKRLHDCSNISEMVVENSSVNATPCYCRLHRARRCCSCMLQISYDHQRRWTYLQRARNETRPGTLRCPGLVEPWLEDERPSTTIRRNPRPDSASTPTIRSASSELMTLLRQDANGRRIASPTAPPQQSRGPSTRSSRRAPDVVRPAALARRRARMGSDAASRARIRTRPHAA